MASNPSNRPEQKRSSNAPKKQHRLPNGALAANELAVIKERDPVDYDTAVAWLNGEGPDPWNSVARKP